MMKLCQLHHAERKLTQPLTTSLLVMGNKHHSLFWELRIPRGSVRIYQIYYCTLRRVKFTPKARGFKDRFTLALATAMPVLYIYYNRHVFSYPRLMVKQLYGMDMLYFWCSTVRCWRQRTGTSRNQLMRQAPGVAAFQHTREERGALERQRAKVSEGLFGNVCGMVHTGKVRN